MIFLIFVLIKFKNNFYKYHLLVWSAKLYRNIYLGSRTCKSSIKKRAISIRVRETSRGIERTGRVIFTIRGSSQRERK